MAQQGERPETAAARAHNLQKRVEELENLLEYAQSRADRAERRLESMHDGLWMLDRSARTVWANGRMAALLRCSPEELRNSTLFDFVYPDDLDRTLDTRRRRLDGEAALYDFRFRRADGEPLQALVSTCPVSDGASGIAGAIATVIDIGGRRRSQVAMAESRRRLDELVNGVAAILFEADPASWQFRYVSSHAEPLLGHPLERWYERGFWIDRVVHPAERAAVEERMRRDAAEGRDSTLTYRAVRTDGSVVTVRDVRRPVVSASGEVTALQGMMIGIPEEPSGTPDPD